MKNGKKKSKSSQLLETVKLSTDSRNSLAIF